MRRSSKATAGTEDGRERESTREEAEAGERATVNGAALDPRRMGSTVVGGPR